MLCEKLGKFPNRTVEFDRLMVITNHNELLQQH